MELLKAEKILKRKFKDKKLLQTAFTHSSYTVGDTGSNERLEHIGDEIIKFLVTDILFDLYPKSQPDVLTEKRKQAITNKNSEAIRFIVDNKLDEMLLLGKSQKNSGGVTDNMRADLFEALFGAMYKDGCRISSLKNKLIKILKLGTEDRK